MDCEKVAYQTVMAASSQKTSHISPEVLIPLILMALSAAWHGEYTPAKVYICWLSSTRNIECVG